MICLDSSILIDYFRKTDKKNSFLVKLQDKHDSFSVSIITTFEIYCGASDDKSQVFWNNIFDKFTVLPFDEDANSEALKIYRNLKKRNKLIEMPDLFIGATAKFHSLPLATLNTKHFRRIEGLEIITSP